MNDTGLTRDEAAERPWPLPEGWAWATVKNVAEKVGTIDPRQIFADREFHYIDLSALDSGRVTRAQLIAGATAPSRARQVVMAGDTLFSCVRVYLENIGLVGPGLHDPIASTAYCVLRPAATIDSRYLNYFVRSRRFIDWLIPLQRGNSPPAVVDSDVKSQPIPLAPLAEQKRIVARIDALFAEIDEGEKSLVEARNGLATFRRALLKSAVTGELTKDWRAGNPPVETGHDLLARIARDRASSAPKPRTRRGTATPALNTATLPRLPDSWAWATVHDVGLVQLGRQRAPQHHNGEHMRPYMRVANVFEDRIDLDDVMQMNFSPAEFETYCLHDGDVLLNEGQTPDLLGRAAIWRNQINGCCFQNTLIRFRAYAPVSPEWSLLVFRHYLHAKRFKRESQITTNIAHLSAGRFATIEFPVPPPEEVAEILHRVSEALAAASDTEAMLDAEAADAARLKQAILKSAFEGRLVPQDPADEPAGALLARLAAAPAVPRRGRRRG